MRTETILLLLIFGFCGFVWNSDAVPIPPITKYTRGYKERVEYIIAVIHQNDLDKGTPPSKKVQAYSKSMSPYKHDDAGHLIAARLGGTGRETYNIVPQNRTPNRGKWRTQIEGPIYKAVKQGNIVTYEVWPQYKTKYSTRPASLKYLARQQNGIVVVNGIMSNPIPSKMEELVQYDSQEADYFDGPIEEVLDNEQRSELNVKVKEFSDISDEVPIPE